MSSHGLSVSCRKFHLVKLFLKNHPLKMSEQKLHRELGLKEATALNMIDMVGIGPFIVVPLVVGAM